MATKNFLCLRACLERPIGLGPIVKKAKLSYGSAPWSLDDDKLNDRNGGRGIYFKDPNGDMLELMTVPQ